MRTPPVFARGVASKQSINLDCHGPKGPRNDEAYAQYLSLLSRWNKTYNLTALRSEAAMRTHHILDSLAIAPYIHGEDILDVGSGAGLPGIPLAIYFPKKHVTLVESQGKKCQFLETVKRALKLTQVTVVNSRVEAFFPEKKFDTIVSRAVGKVQLLINLTKHLIADDGQWILMKGQIPTEELKDLPYPYEVKTYEVPGVDAARCVVCIHNKKE